MRTSTRNLLGSCLAASILGLVSAAAQPVPIIFSNDTGMSGSQIFLQFLPGGQSTGLYSNVDGYFIDAFGNNQTIQTNTAYSLDQLTAPGEQAARLFVGNFNGRIYMNYGPYGLQNLGANAGGYTPSAASVTDPNYNTRYQYWEQTIKLEPDGSSTVYADLSYIDFTAISMSMYARNTGNLSTSNPNTWAVNTNVQNGNQTTSHTQALVNATLGTAANQTMALLPTGASSTLPNNNFTRVISPQFSANGTYYDFTQYLNYLDGKSVHLSGNFSGVGSPTSSNTTLTGQTYDLTGNFTNSAITVPGANATVNATFSGGGIVLNSTNLSGIANTPGSTGVGNVTIYIAREALNSTAGIYGNNMPFAVYSSTTNTTTFYDQLPNNVFGRSVGDLLAGLSFGYVGSNQTFTFNGNQTTIGALSSTQWWANGQGNSTITMPDGSVVSWGETPAGQGIYFANAVTGNNTYGQPTFFNAYASSLVQPDYLTPAYGFPLQDRLGNNLLVYNTGAAGTQNTSLQIVMNPDALVPLATSIWTGNASNGQWGNATNWSNNTVPDGNASAQFVGNHTQTYAVDTGANRTVTGIAFNYAAGNFTISNNTITLGGDVVNSSNKTQTINSALMLSSNATITAAFGDLALGGAIALSNSATPRTLTFSGTEATTASGDISDGQAAGGRIVKNGNGTLVLSGNNSFTGGLEHREGTVVLGSNSAAGTGNLTLGTPGGDSATLSTGNASRSISNAILLAGNSSIAPGGSLSASGPVTLQTSVIPQGNTTTNITSFTITTHSDLTLSGPIGQSLAGNVTSASLVKAGSGNLTLSGSSSNTFNGTLAVNDGNLLLNKSGGASAYGGVLAVGDGVGAAGSARVVLLAGNQTTPTGGISMGTDGVLDIGSHTTTVGNMTLSGGSIIGNGTMALAGNSTVQFVGTGLSSTTINSAVEILPTGNRTTTFAVLANEAARQVVLNGPLTGNGTLTKSGSGVMSITTNSSFSGDLTIAGGILETRNLGNASIDLSNGALSPGGSNSITTIEVASLISVPGNGTDTLGSFYMDLGINGGNGTSDRIQVLNPGVTLNGTVFLFKAAGLSGAGSANFTLLTGSSPNIATSTLTFASVDIAGLTGYFHTDNSTGTLSFISNYGANATWNGTTSDWNTGTNWDPAGVPAAGADIYFSSNTASTSVSTSTNQTTGSLRFDPGAAAYTISGNTITLGGNIINNSTVTQTINSNLALNASRSILSNTGNVSIGGNVALSNVAALPGTLTIDGNASTTISGVVSDGPAAGGALTKKGNGTLTLTGNNTYTGATIVSDGTIAVNSAFALGAGDTSNKNVLIMDGGTLLATANYFGNQTAQRIVNLVGDGTFNPNGNTMVLGEITGSGDLIINDPTGNGTVVLQQIIAPNSYTGATLIQNGTLSPGDSTTLGATSGVTVSSGGALLFNSTMAFNNIPLTISGNGNALTPAALRVQSGTVTWGSAVALGANASISVAANETLNLNSNSQAPGLLLGNNTLTAYVGDDAFLKLAGSPTGSGGIVKTGNGTLNLTYNGTFNTGYNGTTTVAGGVVNMGSPTTLGNGTSSMVVNGGTLSFGAASETPFSFASVQIGGTGFNPGSGSLGAINLGTTLAGNVILAADNLTLTSDALIYAQSGSLSVTAPVNLGNHTLSIDNLAGEMVFSGPVTGTGGILAYGNVSGIRLSGNNSYSGPTTAGNGTNASYITAAHNNALGNSTVTVNNQSSLYLADNITITNTVYLNGGGVNSLGALRNISGNNTFAGTGNLTGTVTIGSANGTLTYASDLANAGGLTFQTDRPDAQVVVTGNYTGTGGATIQGNGTTTIVGGADSASSGQITVNSGTFVSGNLSSATLVISPLGNGTAPAYAPGGAGNVQNVHISGLTVSAGSKLLFDLTTSDQSDKITLLGPSSMGGTTSPAFHFSSTSNATALGNRTFTLIHTTHGQFGTLTPTFTTDANLAGLAGVFGGYITKNLTFTTFSQNATWDGTAGPAWGDNANWNVGVTPDPGSGVHFNSTANTTVDTGQDRVAGGMIFGAGSLGLLVANNTISTYGQIRNDSSNLQTISSNLTLVGDTTVNANSANLALTGGRVNFGSTSGRTLTFTGGNHTTVSGNITTGNGTTGNLVKTGTGTLTLTGNNTFAGTTVISEGTLVLDGRLSALNTVVVGANGTLAGSGEAAGTVGVFGTLSPGNSPGTLDTGSEVWYDGGDYFWEVADVTGSAGSAYDTIAVTGTLNLTNLGTGGFTIDLWTLSSVGPDVHGNAANFDQTQNYSWTIVTTTSGILGFQAGDFVVDDSGFTNPKNGNFAVTQSGNNLLLHYTAIPEPATWALLAGGLAAFLATRRRRPSN